MDRLIKFLFIIITFCNISFAQSNDVKTTEIRVSESVCVQTNATVFLAGESILFKLSCIDPLTGKLSCLSKIAYIELINTSKEVVFKQKLFLKNSTGNGNYFVPTTISTGSYKLIGYTSLMLNNNDLKNFSIDIAIINPFQTINQDLNNSKTVDDKTVINNFNNENISVPLNKKNYTPREKISFTPLVNADKYKKGNYTISVRKIDDLSRTLSNDFVKNFNAVRNNSNTIVLNDNISYFPEFRGEIVSGKIKSNKTENSIENKTVSLSIPGKLGTFTSTKTDKSGKFIFNIEKPDPNNNVILQIIDKNTDGLTIELDTENKINYSFIVFNNNLNLTPNLKNTIEDRSIANQIENVYFKPKKDSIINPVNTNRFFDPSSKEYILENYTRFPTLKETIVEVLNEIYYKQDDNHYNLYVRQPDIINNDLINPALTLVDGLFIKDIDELFEYNTKNFYKVSIVSGGYYYGSTLYNGIIYFTTINKDYKTKLTGDYILKANLLRPSNNKLPININYANQLDLNRIPDYRYQLLWLPNASIENEISFYTSDILGNFEITIEGFTENGEAVSNKEYFEVK